MLIVNLVSEILQPTEIEAANLTSLIVCFAGGLKKMTALKS